MLLGLSGLVVVFVLVLYSAASLDLTFNLICLFILKIFLQQNVMVILLYTHTQASTYAYKYRHSEKNIIMLSEGEKEHLCKWRLFQLPLEVFILYLALQAHHVSCFYLNKQKRLQLPVTFSQHILHCFTERARHFYTCHVSRLRQKAGLLVSCEIFFYHCWTLLIPCFQCVHCPFARVAAVLQSLTLKASFSLPSPTQLHVSACSS